MRGPREADEGPDDRHESRGGVTASGTVSLTYGGTAPTYVLHVPAPAPAGPRPLVVNMHGYTGSGMHQEGLTAMDAVADQAGFFVAYPNGLGSPTDWNAGARRRRRGACR
jgi:polyhydroxybutyrate depolymerase